MTAASALERLRRAAMRGAYSAFGYSVLPVLLGVVGWRGLRDRRYWGNLPQRFGFGPPLSGRAIWVHAVSVGEVQASAPLVHALRRRAPEAPLVLTTVTPTGAEHARSLFGDEVSVRYAPYDLPGAVKRFFRHVRPRLAIIMETELWPNLYNECGRQGVPLVLASARISPRSVHRYRRLAGLFRETLANGIVIAAQSDADAERFRSVGAVPERTHVTGNIKFDFKLAHDIVPEGRALRGRLASARPVWVAASTHAGEEEIVLEAHRQLLARRPDALLMLVPRHPQRFDLVAQTVARSGFELVRRSEAQPLGPGHSVFLGDTLGELLVFYAAADVAFVAGSLVPVGGHNLLEPASLGLPVLVGPYTFKCEDIAEMFVSQGAARVVSTAEELAGEVDALLGDAERRRRMGALGRGIIEDNRGSVERLLELLEPLLAPGARASVPR